MATGLENQSHTFPELQRSSLEDFASLRTRKRELIDEQRSAWNEGHPRPPEDFLRRWPVDSGADPDAASLILEDYLQRRRKGFETSLVEYERRFPEHKQALAGLLAQDTVLRSMDGRSDSSRSSLRLPEVGDEIFKFRLLLPLGQGAFGRVFLAEQEELAGRPVVLKVTANEGEEPQTLAQLLHTNIVPIYSLHEDQRAGLRAVCMPYLGGASLSAVLTKLWADTPRPTAGRELVGALESVEAPRPESLKGRRPMIGAAGPPENAPAAAEGVQREDTTPAAALSELTYERAAASIVAKLADGLHHAHQRGILHRDIKPSNILISAEGQPLLLDFNLSPPQEENPAHAAIGGTVAYMAPEHLRALIGRTPALIRRVDERSDIYSLGMVLAEMLTGHRPFEQSGSYSALPLQIEAMAVVRSTSALSLRQERPDISWGIESIVRKCLAPDAADRYQQADHLSEDLRRLVDDRPLKYAPELSRREQLKKFLKRHPRLTSSGTVAGIAAVFLVAIGSVLSVVRHQLAETSARELVRAHDAGVLRALCLVNTRVDMQDNLRDGIAACEQTLALLGGPEDSNWYQNPKWDLIPPDDRRRLCEDRRELLILLADGLVRSHESSAESISRALALLDRAETIPGLPPSRALWLDRSRYYALISDGEHAKAAQLRASQTPASSARDHYLLATTIVRQGGRESYQAAIAELNEALRKNPCHYWSLIQRGICHLELGELVEASSDFGQCIGIWPEFALGYFNRGCVLDRIGNKAGAVADFTAALDRDPTLLAALINRGLARLEIDQEASALADLDRAHAVAPNDPSVSAGRGIALERLGRHAEADAAFAECFANVGGLPGPVRARLAWAYGFAISVRDPEKALAAFNDALRYDPGNSQAQYGRAMLAMKRGDLAEAIRCFDRTLAANPALAEARRYRAIALARNGAWARATQEINSCLDHEPASAATLYAAACVVSLAFEKTGASANSRQALDLLKRALEAGVNPVTAQSDPDLASIRAIPQFQRLITEAQNAKQVSTVPR